MGFFFFWQDGWIPKEGLKEPINIIRSPCIIYIQIIYIYYYNARE
jgi:hypothetical protein